MQFSSLFSAIQFCLPEIVELLEEILYEYDPELSSLILKALVQIVHQREAETLLQRRPDLFIFKQVTEQVSGFLETPEEGEKLKGFEAIKFMVICLDDFIKNNAKLLLTQFGNSSLGPIIEKNVS